MVKRKAELCLQTEESPERSSQFGEPVEVASEPSALPPTVRTVGDEEQPRVPANRETPQPVHMAENVGSEADMFWLLLEQVGYHTW